MHLSNDDLAAAIKAFTKHVRQPPGIPSEQVGGPQADKVDLLNRFASIEEVCAEMDALAQKPDSLFSDFDALRRRMGTSFPSTPQNLVSAVAYAFLSVGRLEAKK